MAVTVSHRLLRGVTWKYPTAQKDWPQPARKVEKARKEMKSGPPKDVSNFQLKADAEETKKPAKKKKKAREMKGDGELHDGDFDAEAKVKRLHAKLSELAGAVDRALEIKQSDEKI
mgnify:CR=1 FL=1